MSWHRRLKEHEARGTPQYGEGTECTIKMYYGGQIEKGPEVIYNGGQVAWFDFVETGILSLPELRQMLKDLGLRSKLKTFTFFHKLPDMALEHGLRMMNNDTDVLEIQNHIPAGREVDVYVDMPGVGDISGIGGRKAYEYTGDSDESSDCSYFGDSEYDSCEDDMLFNENVDREAEYAGLNEVVLDKVKEKAKGKSKGLDLSLVDFNVHNKDPEYDSDDGLKGYKSDDECQYAKRGMAKGREFNPNVDMENPKFELYMTFKDHKLFQEAVIRHSIVEKRQISFVQQRSYKVRAICKHPCPWLIYASKQQHEKGLMVKTYNPTHRCNVYYKSKHMKSGWLANEYIGEFRENPKKPARDFKSKVYGDHSMNISRNQAYRAKYKALNMIHGGIQEQYSKLWDYAEELIRRNPGSTVKLKTVEGSVEAGKPMFERFYVCLKALKEGFKHCRPVLSTDGCFLKGEYGGELLVASAIDPNNNWYPIAYAVVESETKSSWLWL